MFSAFNLTITEDFFYDTAKDFEQYIELGKNHIRDGIKSYKMDLGRFIKNKIINGSELQENWFPEIEADIFISHSHDDKDLANALAGWLYDEFKLKVFIDSNVWGYTEQLLDEINNKYSKKRDNNGNWVYDRSTYNIVSQHVNIMLSSALQKIIDKVECVILLNTDNSVNIFKGGQMNTTYSPWIYSEILCTQIVRKKPLLSYRTYKMPIFESTEAKGDVVDLLVSYNVSLDHLVDLEENDLMLWLEKYSRKNLQYPLDALYCSTYPDELNMTKNLFYDRTFATKLKKYIK